MLRSQTKVMVLSQSANLSLTFIVLFIVSGLAPSWNGMIGALAQSVGLLTELCVLVFIIFRSANKLEQKNIYQSRKSKSVSG
jgi:hypothetical protein